MDWLIESLKGLDRTSLSEVLRVALSVAIWSHAFSLHFCIPEVFAHDHHVQATPQNGHKEQKHKKSGTVFSFRGKVFSEIGAKVWGMSWGRTLKLFGESPFVRGSPITKPCHSLVSHVFHHHSVRYLHRPGDWNQINQERNSAVGWTVWPSGRPPLQPQVCEPNFCIDGQQLSTRRSIFPVQKKQFSTLRTTLTVTVSEEYDRIPRRSAASSSRHLVASTAPAFLKFRFGIRH